VKRPLVDYFRSNKNRIVYNVLKTQKGWQVQAFLPRRISPDDRITILDWFHTYRSKVLEQHPLWLTVFNGTDQAYFLDIVQVDTPQELIAETVGTGQTWQQLELDYA
jgi:hypothetical protein